MQVKHASLLTLNARDLKVATTAAQVLAALAAAELPAQSWPELVPSLLTNVASQ